MCACVCTCVCFFGFTTPLCSARRQCTRALNTTYVAAKHTHSHTARTRSYKDTKINIVDTPGHADFGGEVERIMNMVDGVLLVVDSVEGPKPQTRFVLRKAIENGVQALLVVNKIDRPAARPEHVVDMTFDLFCELGASDEQTDFSIVYASALKGQSGHAPEELQDGMTPLFDRILELPPPKLSDAGSAQMLIANIDYDEFKGKLGIGRLGAGSLKVGQTVGFMQPEQTMKTGKISELFVFDNLGRKSVSEAQAGEIVMVAGLPDIQVTYPRTPQQWRKMPSLACTLGH